MMESIRHFRNVYYSGDANAFEERAIPRNSANSCLSILTAGKSCCQVLGVFRRLERFRELQYHGSYLTLLCRLQCCRPRYVRFHSLGKDYSFAGMRLSACGVVSSHSFSVPDRKKKQLATNSPVLAGRVARFGKRLPAMDELSPATEMNTKAMCQEVHA